MNIILKKDGTLAVNDSPLEGKEAKLNNLAAFISNPADGDTIVYNGTAGIWEAGKVSGGSMESLSDVDISEPTDGQTLVYNATSEKWENGSGGSGLPEVTADDNGDVLTVVEGAWAKASPAGGALVVNIDSNTQTLDKTWTEIKNALDSGLLVLSTPLLISDNLYLQSYFTGHEYGTVGDDHTYDVFATSFFDGEVIASTFRTDSPNGYPVYHNNQ